MSPEVARSFAISNNLVHLCLGKIGVLFNNPRPFHLGGLGLASASDDTRWRPVGELG